MRRGFIAILVAVLGVTVVPPAPVEAMTPGNCADGVGKTMHVVVKRDSADYDGVIGEADVRTLGPCTAGGGAFSYPAVLPANMEGSGALDIVQIGYLRCGKAAGGICGLDVPADGKNHFVITQRDNCGGCFQKADGWAGLPTLGSRYRFKLYSQDGKWHYCVKNLTTGGAYQCLAQGGQHWDNGPLIWWGTEVQNTKATMGPRDVGQVSMYWMQYSKTLDTSWIVTTNNTIFKTGEPHPAAYHNFTYNVNYTGDALESHTD